MRKKIIILIALTLALFGVVAFFRFSSSGAALLWNASRGGQWLLPLVTVAAAIDSINPCAFSILLLTISFLFSVGGLRTKILRVGGSYIFGLFLVYIMIGLGIFGTLHLFNTPHFMAKLGAVLLLVLGVINVINDIWSGFPLKIRLPESLHHRMAELIDKSSMPTAFVLGGLVGLCEFPCTGGPYLMVLGLLHDSVTYLKGLGYLVFYNLIFILPLVLILFLASDKSILEKVSAWQQSNKRLMRLGGGLAMIVLGTLIFFL